MISPPFCEVSVKTISLICRWLNIVTYVAVAIMMTLTVADVLLRLIFETSDIRESPK